MDTANTTDVPPTIIISLIAIVISGLNVLWVIWLSNRVRLRVDFIRHASGFFWFEVTNKSLIPVTLSKMSMSPHKSTQEPTFAFRFSFPWAISAL